MFYNSFIVFCVCLTLPSCSEFSKNFSTSGYKSKLNYKTYGTVEKTCCVALLCVLPPRRCLVFPTGSFTIVNISAFPSAQRDPLPPAEKRTMKMLIFFGMFVRLLDYYNRS